MPGNRDYRAAKRPGVRASILRRSLGFVGAALASAAIFGIFHYTGASSLGVVPQLAFLGFALCFVYERTGSIYPTIAMHMLNNAFAFAVLVS